MKPLNLLLFLIASIIAMGLATRSGAQSFQIEPPQCTIGAGPQQVVTEGGTCPSGVPLAPYQQIKIIDSPNGSTCTGPATGSKFVLCMADATGTTLEAVVSGGGGGGGDVEEAPLDGRRYTRENATWVRDERLTPVSTEAELAACLREYESFGSAGSGGCSLAVPVIEVAGTIPVNVTGLPVANLTSTMTLDCLGGTLRWTAPDPDNVGTLGGQMFFFDTAGRPTTAGSTWTVVVKNCVIQWGSFTTGLTTATFFRLYNQNDAKGNFVLAQNTRFEGGSQMPYLVYRESFQSPGIGEGYFFNGTGNTYRGATIASVYEKIGSSADSGGRNEHTLSRFEGPARALVYYGGDRVRLANNYFWRTGITTDRRIVQFADDIFAPRGSGEGQLGAIHFETEAAGTSLRTTGLGPAAVGEVQIAEGLVFQSFISGAFVRWADLQLRPFEDNCGISLFSGTRSPGLIDIDRTFQTCKGDAPPVSGDFDACTAETAREHLGSIRIELMSVCSESEVSIPADPGSPFVTPRSFQALNATTHDADMRQEVDLTWNLQGGLKQRTRVFRDGRVSQSLDGADYHCATFDDTALATGAAVVRTGPGGGYLQSVDCLTDRTEVSNLLVGGLLIPSCNEAVSGEVVARASCGGDEDCSFTLANAPVVPGTIRIANGAEQIFDDFRRGLVGESVNRGAQGTVVGESQTGACTNCSGQLSRAPVVVDGSVLTRATDGTLTADWDGNSWTGDVDAGTARDETLSGVHFGSALFGSLSFPPINPAVQILVDYVDDGTSDILTNTGGNNWSGETGLIVGNCPINLSDGGFTCSTSGTSGQDVRFRYSTAPAGANSLTEDGAWAIPFSGAVGALSFDYSWSVENDVDYSSGELSFTPATATAADLSIDYQHGSGTVYPARLTSVPLEPFETVTIDVDSATLTGPGDTTICVGVSR